MRSVDGATEVKEQRYRASSPRENPASNTKPRSAFQPVISPLIRDELKSVKIPRRSGGWSERWFVRNSYGLRERSGEKSDIPMNMLNVSDAAGSSKHVPNLI